MAQSRRTSARTVVRGAAAALLTTGGVAALFFVPALAAESTAEPLIFAGSGSNLGITRLLSEGFRRTRRDLRIEVPASIGSSGGVRAASEGAIAVGLVSRPLRESEKDLGLTVLPYARTAVVVAVHPTVAEDQITFDELVQVYRGTKSRWPDGREIIVLSREHGDSSIEVLERVIPGFKEAYEESEKVTRWSILFNDQEMSRALARTPGAIGLADSGSILAERLPLKALKFNGVLPAPDDVLRGRYPLVKTLAFVFRKDLLPPGARAFMDFVRSREGGKILKANGYVPVR